MKCRYCGQGLIKAALYRTNPLGETGVWVHKDCATKEESEKFNPTLVEIATVIDESNHRKDIRNY